MSEKTILNITFFTATREFNFAFKKEAQKMFKIVNDQIGDTNKNSIGFIGDDTIYDFDKTNLVTKIYWTKN